LQVSADDFFETACRIAGKRAWMLSGLFGFRREDIPDIKQELLLEIYRQRENFDPERGNTTAFISQIVSNKITDIIRYQQANCRDWRLRGPSLNTPVSIPGCEHMELIDFISNNGDFSESNVEERNFHTELMDVHHIIAYISPDLQELCEDLKFMSIREAAAERGISVSVLSYQIRKLRKLFTGCADLLNFNRSINDF
jgi:DNA-directed RNA polymerase specialized sigma24 family protein